MYCTMHYVHKIWPFQLWNINNAQDNKADIKKNIQTNKYFLGSCDKNECDH